MQKNQTKLNAALESAKRDDWNNADTILNGFGIEYVECGDRELKYINLGDTYDLTICQENDDSPFISSWGDWYEQTEQEHCKENDVIHCGYCGEFTPMNQKNWHDVVCEYCGHLVGG